MDEFVMPNGPDRSKGEVLSARIEPGGQRMALALSLRRRTSRHCCSRPPPSSPSLPTTTTTIAASSKQPFSSGLPNSPDKDFPPPDTLPFTTSTTTEELRRRQPREDNCNALLEYCHPHLPHIRHRAFFAAAATNSPPFFPSGLVIDHRLPHNTPPTPPKCLPQSSSVAVSPSPRG